MQKIILSGSSAVNTIVILLLLILVIAGCSGGDDKMDVQKVRKKTEPAIANKQDVPPVAEKPAGDSVDTDKKPQVRDELHTLKHERLKLQSEIVALNKVIGENRSTLFDLEVKLGLRQPEPEYIKIPEEPEPADTKKPDEPEPAPEVPAPEADIIDPGIEEGFDDMSLTDMMNSIGQPQSEEPMDVSAPEVDMGMAGLDNVDEGGLSNVPVSSPKSKSAKPLDIRAETTEPDKIDLSWDVPEEEDVVSYNVYRDGVFMKSVTGTSYAQDELEPGTSYCYIVAAVNRDGQEVGTENVCTKTLSMPDAQPPDKPLGFVAKVVTAHQIDIHWKVPKDNVMVKGYNIYQDGALIMSSVLNSVVMAELNSDTAYCYAVTAFDHIGNESLNSDEACAITPYEDSKRPSTPLALSSSEIAGDQIDLAWDSSTDDVGVVGYNIYEDGVFLKAVASTSAFNIEMEEEESHCYSISAMDDVGNESRKSQQVCVTKKMNSKEQDIWGGTVWAGGVNEYGQLGNGTFNDSITLTLAKDLKGVIRVASGLEHVLAIKADGTVWAWGRNDKGQLGDGTTVMRNKPVQIKNLKNIVNISAGMSHSLALEKNGTVWAWGRNYYGQLGDGSDRDRNIPAKIPNLDKVIDIAAGGYHGMALKTDRTVWTWGWNTYGQLGDNTKKSRPIPIKVVGLTGVDLIAAGTYHSVALKSDGTVWIWGQNTFGQLGNDNKVNSPIPLMAKNMSEVETIAAGVNHTVALKVDGTVWTWGRNEYGQLGKIKGNLARKPTLVEDIKGVKEIAAGFYHTVALKADGSIWSWGWKTNVRYSKNEAIPARISGLTGIVSVDAGMKLTVAVKGY